MLAESLTEAGNLGLDRAGTYADSGSAQFARFLQGDEAESCHGDV